MTTLRLMFLPLTALLWLAQPAFAVLPDEVLSDAGLEARARALSAELRCMVCQNQSIDDSNADLARDLRVLVRERLVAGDTDDQVLDYVVARYGEFVLLKPRYSLRNALLWATPLVLLGAGATYMAVRSRQRSHKASEKLTAAEEARLAEILRRDEA